MAAIEIQGLSKRFGEITAVDDLSFSTREGAVTGFLGPNGAGKTTTLRMLLGLVTPTEGTATVDGRPYAELADPTRHVGAVLESTSFHPGRRARQHLRVLATAAGLPLERAPSTRSCQWRTRQVRAARSSSTAHRRPDARRCRRPEPTTVKPWLEWALPQERPHFRSRLRSCSGQPEWHCETAPRQPPWSSSDGVDGELASTPRMGKACKRGAFPLPARAPSRRRARTGIRAATRRMISNDGTRTVPSCRSARRRNGRPRCCSSPRQPAGIEDDLDHGRNRARDLPARRGDGRTPPAARV
jgi:energy-coupling factor transporter ATP-binding protein EcfA2